MKLTSLPRISAATVDTTGDLEESVRRFTPVTLGLRGGIQPVIGRAAQREGGQQARRHAARWRFP